MKDIVFIIIVLIVLDSCCKKVDAVTYCNVENPLEDLEWLKEKYDPNEYSTDTSSSKYYNSIIYKQYYDGSEYIEINTPMIFASVTWDCSGNFVCSDPSPCPTLLDKTLKRNITLAPVY